VDKTGLTKIVLYAQVDGAVQNFSALIPLSETLLKALAQGNANSPILFSVIPEDSLKGFYFVSVDLIDGRSFQKTYDGLLQQQLQQQQKEKTGNLCQA